jgi:hypothetical protein
MSVRYQNVNVETDESRSCDACRVNSVGQSAEGHSYCSRYSEARRLASMNELVAGTELVRC